MRKLDAEWVARAAGATLRAGDPGGPGPAGAVIDTREAGEGRLFVGLPGERADGGAFAADALLAGAWGVLVSPEHTARAVAAAPAGARVLEAQWPLASLGALAREWRRELGCRVIGVTGSTGKTSTKDILAAVLASHLSTHASRENFNTEIGLPLTILEAEEGTDALVLEMAMRGEGQIAELAAIAEPDAGVIVNVGPVHLELLGTVERVAAAKAELIRDLRPGAACVVPAGEPLLERHLRDDLDTITFGPGGDVSLLSFERGRGRAGTAEIEARGEPRVARAGLRRAPQPPEHPRRRGRRGGRGREAGGAGRCALLVPSRGGRGARGRGDRGQRLLQRQPDVDAGGPPAPRRDARRPAIGGARDHGGAGPRLGRLPPRDRRRAGHSGDRRPRDRGGGGHPVLGRLRGRDLRRPDTRGGRRPARGDRPARRPGAREGDLASVGLERVLS